MGIGGFSLIVLFVLAAAMGGGILLISSLVGRHRAPPERGLPYECGLDPIGQPRRRLAVKYFLVAVLFILFDVEVVFFYPWALVFRGVARGGMGMFVFIEMAIFLGILGLALAYAWGKGALEWEK